MELFQKVAESPSLLALKHGEFLWFDHEGVWLGCGECHRLFPWSFDVAICNS